MARKLKKVSEAKTISSVVPEFIGESRGSVDVSFNPTDQPYPYGSAARSRPRAIKTFDSLANVRALPSPFGSYNNYIDIKDAIELCQKAYYNFPVLRNTIDVMTELSNSPIFLKGGNAKSREFIEAWFDKINLFSLKERYFREIYRSSNWAVIRFDGTFTDDDVKRITQVYGASATTETKIPIRYVLLNPSDLKALAGLDFSSLQYYKVLTYQELEKIRHPKTDADKQIAEQLGINDKSVMKQGGTPYMLLDPDRLYMLFYKKQDYEPFAVPMAFPILEDIDWKLELKKVDRAIARTTEWCILLVTMGTEPDKGGINQANVAAIKEVFKNESIKRVLVSDYTTKVEWVIPDIANILDPKKYEEVNESIKLGLNILVAGDEKYANSMVKTALFLERLKQARSTFIYEFLLPEIKRICLNMGFKNYPTPYFEELDLKDELQFAKVYTRLMELGIFTPEQGIDALETGKLPDKQDLLLAQEEYKKSRDKGLYTPLIGGPKVPDAGTGRPAGTKAPQSTKKMTPIGASFSFSKFKDNIILADKVLKRAEGIYKEENSIKRVTQDTRNTILQLMTTMFANEQVENWDSKIEEYLLKPLPISESIGKEIDEICQEHGVSEYLAILLHKS